MDSELEMHYLVDRPEFVPLVIDWWRTAWADRMGNDIDLAREQLYRSLSKSELPLHVLAFHEGAPIGTAALKRQELVEVFPDYHYWLGSVFVPENARGGRVASQMSLHIVDLARQMHLPHLYLQTINLNGGLYSKLGWQGVSEFTHMNEHALLMYKEL